ncbi:MAG: N-acetyltransferase [Clostridia bacterium]|nr:N-acetyltransferase [Clostridia bacterium]
MNFELREWTAQDIPSLAHYADNEKIARWLRDAYPYPYTQKDAENYISSCLSAPKDKQLCRAIVVDGSAVGSIGVFCCGDIYRRSAELGYWLAEEFWGKGIMTAATKQICTAAFESFDIVRIYAEPFYDNAGSRKVLENAGFVLEGVMKNGVFKLGQLHDYCMYALLRN